ncbi:hypothetical protein HZB78_02960 [Candidatus Collierbacteria bacterium]|nr:hypothetical protein [Candidatus Collierbacteria bacterium]
MSEQPAESPIQKLMGKESDEWKPLLGNEPSLPSVPECIIQHLTAIEANHIPIIAIPKIKDLTDGTWVTPVAPFDLKNPDYLKRLQKITGGVEINKDASVGQAVAALAKIGPYRLPTLDEWRLLGERLGWVSDSYGVTATLESSTGHNQIVLTGYEGGGGISCYHSVPPDLKTDNMNFHLVFDWNLLQNSLEKDK